ncbi:MAG: CDP-glycerol glycerophosphotransferase family protein [Dehalobacter sp.]|nr:CDP-glycerol glycerophosphotransferase family protein [Dehalobacter sp.]
MLNILYVGARKALPLFIKRKIVLFSRGATIFCNKYLGLKVKSIMSLHEKFLESVPQAGGASVNAGLLIPVKHNELRFAVDLIDVEDLLETQGLKSLLFIESAAAKFHYKQLIEFSLTKQCFIVFRAKKDYLEFIDSAVSMSVLLDDISGRVLYIPTIDPALDESVYLQADTLSAKFIDCLGSELSNTPQYEKFSHFLNSLQVGVSDRLVGWVRSYNFILNFAETHAVEKFYIFGNRLLDNNLLAFAVGSSRKIPTAIVRFWCGRRFKSLSQVVMSDMVSRDWIPSDRFTTTKYHISDCCEKGDNIFIFFGNLRDPMYKGTLLPVLQQFVRKTNEKILVLLPYADVLDDDNKRYTYILPSVEKDDASGMAEFNKYFDLALDAFLSSPLLEGTSSGLLALYAALNSRKSLHRLFRDSYGLMREIDRTLLVANVSALISNPGRLWPSQFTVGYLKSVASFDIQSGTFSRSGRYKKPGSTYVLAVDDFSRAVYVDYLGVNDSNVEVVGAPRIDARLSAIRAFTKEQSREAIAICDTTYNILCLATQPYDIDLMSSMVRVACDFLESHDDWFLLISMHPNENDAFANAYSAVLRNLDCSQRAVISRGNIYHNLNASDAVITYFSTAGLEAFCLDKPVLAYRPKDYSTVPFDLCELGVARPFVGRDDLNYLLNSSSERGSGSQGLMRLKDGRSVERICDFILGRVAEKKLLE